MKPTAQKGLEQTVLTHSIWYDVILLNCSQPEGRIRIEPLLVLINWQESARETHNDQHKQTSVKAHPRSQLYAAGSLQREFLVCPQEESSLPPCVLPCNGSHSKLYRDRRDKHATRESKRCAFCFFVFLPTPHSSRGRLATRSIFLELWTVLTRRVPPL